MDTVPAPTIQADPADLAVELWTMPEFKQARKAQNNSIFIQVLIGWVIAIAAGLLFGGRELTGFSKFIGYGMVLLGLWLGLFKWMFQGRGNIAGFRSRASKEAGWFREVVCPNCGKTAEVNIGYLEYQCESCGDKNYRMADRIIRLSGNKVLGNPKPPEQLIMEGTTCVSCKKPISLKDRQAVFYCPNCQTDAYLKHLPIAELADQDTEAAPVSEPEPA